MSKDLSDIIVIALTALAPLGLAIITYLVTQINSKTRAIHEDVKTTGERLNVIIDHTNGITARLVDMSKEVGRAAGNVEGRAELREEQRHDPNA